MHSSLCGPGKWLLRIVFLETVAGVPGMVAALQATLGFRVSVSGFGGTRILI